MCGHNSFFFLADLSEVEELDIIIINYTINCDAM